MDSACLKLAELHSKAVDYPKNGNKVDIRSLPRQFIPFKPDWHAVEQPTLRQPDYYESTRALGYMYRNITLEGIPDYPPHDEEPGDNPVFLVLRPLVQRQLGNQMHHSYREQIDPIYMEYQEELKYISTTYSLSKTPLREEELVLETILANSASEKYKGDRIYAMKESLSFLVDGVRRGLVQELADAPDEVLKEKLACVWNAWKCSLEKSSEGGGGSFGSHSFGLIALSLVLECLVRLGGLPSW